MKPAYEVWVMREGVVPPIRVFINAESMRTHDRMIAENRARDLLEEKEFSRVFVVKCEAVLDLSK